MAADLTDKHRPAVHVMLIESKPMDTGMVTIEASALDQNLISTGKAVIYGITFDFDKADIKPESKPQLDQIAKLMNDHADLKLAITGHTDNQGAADYNQKLSQRRADEISPVGQFIWYRDAATLPPRTSMHSTRSRRRGTRRLHRKDNARPDKCG